MTLKEYITASYGASVYKRTVQLKETKKNIAKTKNQFIFLQKCVKNKLIPKSLRIRCPIRSNRGKEVTKKYRFELLLATKNDAKHRFFSTIKEADQIEEDLVSKLDFADMEIIRKVTEEARESMFLRSRERLQKKFKILEEEREAQQRSNDPRPSVVKTPILNLASAEVPKEHLDLLSLGPKFVPNPTRIPYMDIITVTESSALKLEYQKKICEAQVLRKDVLRIMKTARLPKDNLSPDQRQALREMNNDQNVRIYPFDKGTGLVRIEHEEAISKIREQLGDTEVIQNDPTDIFAREIRTALGKLNKKGRFTKKEYEEMYPSDAIPPRMYGTIKAHKPEKQYPMRLVVSTIGTPPHGISAYLVKIIQHTLNKNPSRLKNSASFVEMAKTWSISPTEVQVSFDVVNLYPSIPLKEATKVILDLLKEDPSHSNYTKLKLNEIKEMIELCISRCYFVWNDEIHVLKDSGPIGLSIMVVLAEGFLQVL